MATAARQPLPTGQAANPTPQWALGVPRPLGKASVEQGEAGTAQWVGAWGHQST